MTQESNVAVAATETVFRLTTIGEASTDRIAEIEKSALANLQSGKSLDRVVTGALASARDACQGARASVS